MIIRLKFKALKHSIHVYMCCEQNNNDIRRNVERKCVLKYYYIIKIKIYRNFNYSIVMFSMHNIDSSLLFHDNISYELDMHGLIFTIFLES